jgi:hypothetical protein
VEARLGAPGVARSECLALETLRSPSLPFARLTRTAASRVEVPPFGMWSGTLGGGFSQRPRAGVGAAPSCDPDPDWLLPGSPRSVFRSPVRGRSGVHLWFESCC